MIRLLTILLTSLFLTTTVVHAEEQVFGGVGLQVVPTVDGDLVVLNVLDSSPAAVKGVQPGDLIYQVDDFVLKGSDFGTVVSKHLWGAVGTSVVLHYRRPGQYGNRQVEIVRINIDPRLTVTPSVQDAADSKVGKE